MNEEKKVSFLGQHKMLMLICCLVPVILLLYFLIKAEIVGSGLWLVLLLCPLMHIIMMWGMRGKGHH